jgi:cytidylate kinase
MARGIIVAIDGPAGAGKSTVARRVARRLGFTYIDSGAMYRAVALWALREGLDLTAMRQMEELAKAAAIAFEPGSPRVLLNGEDVTAAIRAPEISDAASRVSAIPGVRRALVEMQRRIGETDNVVMEGRDIGSVVFPGAAVKVYLDADAGERARRRAGQAGVSDQGAVAAEIGERDHRDRTRPESPLVQAPDAVYLDSTSLSEEEVEEAILRLVRARMSNGKEYGKS